MTIHLTGEPKGPKMDLLVYLPAGARGPVPLLLNLSFTANSSMVDDPGVQPGEVWGRERTRVPARRGASGGSWTRASGSPPSTTATSSRLRGRPRGRYLRPGQAAPAPAGGRPHIWDALKYGSARYMAALRDFILSEGGAYQNLQLAREDVRPHKAPGAPADGLDGWAYMMRTPDKRLALLYFEHQSVLPTLRGFTPGARYSFRWYHPASGEWHDEVGIQAGADGTLKIPGFPRADGRSFGDWAAKIVAR